MIPLGTSPDGSNIVASIKLRLNLLIGATVFLLVAVVVIGGYVFLSAKTTHDALCHLRADREKQVTESRHYLATHSDADLAKFGFTRAQVEQQIVTQQQTVDALDPLGCGN